VDIVTGNMHVLMYLHGPGRFAYLFKVCFLYVGACYCGWSARQVICWDHMEQASESCVIIVHLYFYSNYIFYRELFIMYVVTVCTIGT
jgi:hypothetical protein